jgi:hypothetical protein
MTPETNPLSNLSFQEREDLAYNPNTPPEALTILAQDEYLDVRYGVARNPNTPPDPNATREIIQTVRAYEFYLEFNKTH